MPTRPFTRSLTRRRVAVGAAVLLTTGYALATGGVPGVAAIFTAETANPNAVAAGGWIPGPSALSDIVGGAANDQRTLAWTSGASASSPSPNPVTGQTILAADGGSGGAASCGTYTTLATPAAGDTAYADSAGTAADWWCYEVMSTSSGSWTSDVATFTPIRLFVPLSVALANGGSYPGQSENDDTITITYNQDVSVSGNVAVHVCKRFSTITIGSGCSGSPSIGTVTGVTVSTNNGYTGSTIDVSGPTITITLQNQGGRSDVSGGTSFLASGSKVTAAADGTNVCSAASCAASVSGGF
ncbi:MAG: hypothetical protein ACRDL2_02270 [Gaiellaceae bacterium]